MDVVVDGLHEYSKFLQDDLSSIYIVYTVVMTTIGFAGIVGNILAMIVLSRPKMKSNPMNALLFFLAIWDIVTIISLSGVVGSFTIFKNFFPKNDSGLVDVDRFVHIILCGLFVVQNGK